MQGIDFDILELILQAITITVTGIFDATISIDNDSSILMVLFNKLPIVGSDPVSMETMIYLVAGIGVIVAYFRWYR